MDCNGANKARPNQSNSLQKLANFVNLLFPPLLTLCLLCESFATKKLEWFFLTIMMKLRKTKHHYRVPQQRSWWWFCFQGVVKCQQHLIKGGNNDNPVSCSIPPIFQRLVSERTFTRHFWTKIVAQSASKLLVGTGRKGRVDKNKRKLLIFSTVASSGPERSQPWKETLRPKNVILKG